MKTVVLALTACLFISSALAQSCTEATNCGFGFCDRDTLQCVCFTGYSTNETGCYNCARGFIPSQNGDGSCIAESSGVCVDRDCQNGVCYESSSAAGTVAVCRCNSGWTNVDGPSSGCSICAFGFILDQNNRCVLSNPCTATPDPCAARPNEVCQFSNTAGASCVCAAGFIRDPATGGCITPNSNSGCPVENPCGNGACFDAPNSALGYVCRCDAGWAHAVVTNEDGTTRVKFCSTCAAGYRAERTLNTSTGLYVLECKPISPCTNVFCRFGSCDVTSNGEAVCRCKPNFAQSGRLPTSPCDVCAPGYTNPPADRNLPPCSVCEEGFVASGSLCVLSTSDPTCPVPCGDHGTCTQLANGERTCICNEGYIHDPNEPFRRPCSACRDGVSDPSDNCTPPIAGNLTDCNTRCRLRDPNSVCQSEFNVTGEFVGFRCVCSPRYVADERGFCTRCAPGFYSTNEGVCLQSRCPFGCRLGECIANYDTRIPTFECRCPPGYSGPSCEIYTRPPLPCNGKCGENEVCVDVDSSVNINAGTATVRVQRCVCKRNYVDAIGRDGSVIRCGKCAPGWSGRDCSLPSLPNPSACDRIVCPKPSVCTILKPDNGIATNFAARCLCRDGSVFDPATRCGLVADVPDANECKLRCPANAYCVRSGLTSSGVRCVCKEGFFLAPGANRTMICVRERPGPECPLDCPADQVCISALDFSTDPVRETPECVCRSKNAVLVDGECVCKPGYYGPRCSRRRNPCDVFGSRCPPRSECVPVETADGDLSYKCVCKGSFTNIGCTVDRCAGVQCPAGAKCDRNGQCVCPLNQVLSNNVCVDRVRTKPTGTVDKNCADANDRKCIIPPPTRIPTRTRNEDDDKEIKLSRPNVTGDDRIDDFSVNFRTTQGQVFTVCVKRQLGLMQANGMADIQLAIRICLRLVAIEIRTVPEGRSLTDDGDSHRNITIGQLDENGADSRTLIEEDDATDSSGVPTTRFTVRTNDSLVRLECFVANSARAIADTVTSPDNIHCNFILSIPAIFYPTARSKVCFRLFAVRDGLFDGVWTLSTDTTTSRISFFPVKDGVPIGTGADLSFENYALVGDARIGVSYAAYPEATGYIIRGCFNTFNPDEITLDPALGSTAGYEAFENPSSNPTSTNGGVPSAPNAGTNSASGLTVSAVATFVVVALAALLL